MVNAQVHPHTITIKLLTQSMKIMFANQGVRYLSEFMDIACMAAWVLHCIYHACIAIINRDFSYNHHSKLVFTNDTIQPRSENNLNQPKMELEQLLNGQ